MVDRRRARRRSHIATSQVNLAAGRSPPTGVDRPSSALKRPLESTEGCRHEDPVTTVPAVAPRRPRGLARRGRCRRRRGVRRRHHRHEHHGLRREAERADPPRRRLRSRMVVRVQRGADVEDRDARGLPGDRLQDPQPVSRRVRHLHRARPGEELRPAALAVRPQPSETAPRLAPPAPAPSLCPARRLGYRHGLGTGRRRPAAEPDEAPVAGALRHDVAQAALGSAVVVGEVSRHDPRAGPGGERVALDAAAGVPVGSVVDARDGVVELGSAVGRQDPGRPLLGRPSSRLRQSRVGRRTA